MPRMNVMLDFICMVPVNLPGAHQKAANAKWKILAHTETRPHNFEILSIELYQLR